MSRKKVPGMLFSTKLINESSITVQDLPDHDLQWCHKNFE